MGHYFLDIQYILYSHHDDMNKIKTYSLCKMINIKFFHLTLYSSAKYLMPGKLAFNINAL